MIPGGVDFDTIAKPDLRLSPSPHPPSRVHPFGCILFFLVISPIVRVLSRDIYRILHVPPSNKHKRAANSKKQKK